MIPYANLERALARSKARKDGAAPAAAVAPGQEPSAGTEAPRKRFKSSLDWSMDQAIAHTDGEAPVSVAPTDTAEIPLDAISEDVADATPPPVAIDTEPQTGEIDVGDIEEEIPQ